MKEYETIINAALKGRAIQFKDEDKWTDIDHTDFMKKMAVGHPPELFRLKPVTVRIGDIDVPEPAKVALKFDQTYYIPDTNAESLHWAMKWTDSAVDFMRLKRGMVHLAPENSTEHAKAMIISGGGAVA